MPERVRVVVRVRPFLPVDPDDAELAVTVPDSTHVQVNDRHVFAVDGVYAMEATTEELFVHTVQPFVDDFLRGFSATVMAYGQTGTGKTYTMSGLTPLVLQRLVQGGFERCMDQLSVQYVEVYGDTLRDLLVGRESRLTEEDARPTAAPACESKVERAGKGMQLLDAVALHRLDGSPYDDGQTTGTLLRGATRARAGSLAELLQLVREGARLRATGWTSMSEHSSRSHSILTLFNHHTGSKLNLVDLAGSERNKKTQNVGQRFQESIGINTGLLALGNVIRALSHNHHNPHGTAQHVPYRSSKLTRLLQDALGGDSKTLFIACVAPDSYNGDETIRTLQYCALALRVVNEPVACYERLYQPRRTVSRSRSRGRSQEARPGHVEHEVDDAPVSPDAQSRLRHTCHEQDCLIQALRTKLAETDAKAQMYAAELRKDQGLFSRQLDEMRRLADENGRLRRRIGVLEDRQGGVSYIGSGNTSKSAVVADAPGEDWRAGCDTAHRLQAQPRVCATPPLTQLSANGGRSEAPLCTSGTERAGLSDVPCLSSPCETSMRRSDLQRRPCNGALDDEASLPDALRAMPEERGGGEAGAGGDALLCLTREALFYQNNNTELRNRLRSAVALLEAQRRETALLRIELGEAKQALTHVYVDPLHPLSADMT